MFSLLKALIPGIVLTWVVSSVMGSAGSRGGFLNIHQLSAMNVEFYWSWPLFAAGTFLAWAIFQSMK
ncbi:MAG: hypothetical protein HKN78_04435 [Sphingomonadaceae bacterium]|nr:hypothetical protein [Sphingomonadaceae bacterium]